MKKLLVIILGIATIFGLIQQVFNYYNATTVLHNQAAFEIYVDTTQVNINTYFGIRNNTFDLEKHTILCLLPVDIQGFKPTTATVSTDLSTIDCLADFNQSRVIKYEPYELNGANFTLMIVPKTAQTLLLDTPLGAEFILAQKKIHHPYQKGKINRWILSGHGFKEYCH